MPVIDTNDPYSDSVSNAVELLKDHRVELQLRDIYDNDLTYIPNLPSISVTWEDAEEETRNLSGKKAQMTIHNKLQIWYYHEIIETDEKKRVIVAKLNEIAMVLRKHRTLNGFCDVLRSEIQGVEYLPRLRENGIMGAGVITLIAPKNITILSPE